MQIVHFVYTFYPRFWQPCSRMITSIMGRYIKIGFFFHTNVIIANAEEVPPQNEAIFYQLDEFRETSSI